MSYRFQLSAHDRYTVPRLRNVFHISINNCEDIMASDENGTLVRTDINFLNITARPIGGSDEGYHAFTLERNCCIQKRPNDCRRKVSERKTNFHAHFD